MVAFDIATVPSLLTTTTISGSDSAATTAATKKPKKKKKKPIVVRRASSAYMFFVKAKRDGIRKANPHVSMGTLGTITGQAWNASSAEEREPYFMMARNDKVRFENESAALKAALATPATTSSSISIPYAPVANASTGMETKTRTKKKKEKNPIDQGPILVQRNSSAYVSFAKSTRLAIREAHPNATSVELSRATAQAWNASSSREREHHSAMVEKIRSQIHQSPPTSISPAATPTATSTSTASASEKEDDTVDEAMME